MICVSRFPGRRNHNISDVCEWSWGELLSFFQAPLAASIPKDDLPLWTPARYAPAYVEDANVIEVTALGFDVDEAPIPSADTLRALPWHCIASTSSRSTKDAPRWRLVIELTRPVSGNEYRRIWSAVAATLPFPVGRQSRNPSRGWYVPRVGPDGFYEAFDVPGQALDVDAVLRDAPERDVPTGDASAAVQVAETLPEGLLVRARDLGEACALACPSTGGRHELSLQLAGALVSSRLPFHIEPEQVPMFVRETCRAAGFGTLDQKLENGRRTVALYQSGGAVAGMPSLRAAFPLVATALDPLYVEPPKQPAPAPAPAPTVQPAVGFIGVSAAELAKPLPPVSYVVQHFGIARGRPTLLSGYGGLGKTIIIQALCLHIAGGVGHCWGLPVETGPVWHFDYEMTQSPLQRRYQRLAHGHGIALASCALTLCSMPEIYLSDDRAEDELCKATEGVSLAVVDNLAAAAATSDVGENEAGIRRYLDRLTRVTSKTDCAFIVLAHERKGNKNDDESTSLQRVRGSSAITDACGSVISISADLDAGVLILSQRKASAGKAGDDITLKLVDVLGSTPSPDPEGLRVERVGEETRAQAAAAKDSKKSIEQNEEIKQAMLRELGTYPKGLSWTNLRDLLPGRHADKTRPRIELEAAGLIYEFGNLWFLKA